jgi:predicted CXXCH cytochrome family protein
VFRQPASVDLVFGKTSIKVDHFSVYGVFYLSEGIDIDPPKIEKVRSASPSKTFVTFSEFIDTSSVVLAGFEISETTVTTFYPFRDGKTVVVETLYMDPQTPREIYVSGIRDLAGNMIPEDGISNMATFTVVPTPHGRYLDDTNKCSLCHSVHYGKNEKLLLKQTATEVCYICHDTAGTGSKYATQSWFEDPAAVSLHHTRYGDTGIYCTDCHSPHRDNAEVPSLLRFRSETTETTSVAERFCFGCHGASVSTWPASLIIKESSYTAGIHFKTLPGPPSGNGITCLQCHAPHSSVQPTLMRGGTEEYVCILCHKADGVSPVGGVSVDAPDVLSSLLTAPDATVGLPGFPTTRTIWYKHPTIEYSGRHTLEELYDATLAAQTQATTETRHAECEDCHNSHYAGKTIYAEPPFVPESMLGAAGVVVSYPYGTTEPVYSWEPYGSVTYEYQVCLRCHSGFAKAWYGYDLAKLFSPYNGSYHPVISVGKNQTAAMANSLIGLTPQSQILCSDCHFAADPIYPRGPHGSIYPFILSANYRFELKPQSTTDNFDENDFALCFKCHSAGPFKDPTGAPRNDTNFRWHGYHLRMLYNNPGGNGVSGGILTPGAGRGNAICRECHYNPHGSSQSRLVEFAPNVLPTGTRTEPVFVPKTPSQPGYCLLRCHNRGHGTGMNY